MKVNITVDVSKNRMTVYVIENKSTQWFIIGSKGWDEWKKSKGRKYVGRIESKCRKVLHKLRSQYEKTFGVEL